MWITMQVEYEPVNPLANKQPFKQYFSTAPIRIFKRDRTFITLQHYYIDSLQILTDQIREFNAKFIREKSGIQLARVLTSILKMVSYAPLEGCSCQPLPEFFDKKEAVINIWINDEGCFGKSILYFLERANLSERNGNRS